MNIKKNPSIFFLSCFILVACKSNFSGSSQKPNPSNNNTSAPPTTTPSGVNGNTTIGSSTLTITHPIVDPMMEQFQVMLKGSSNWQDVTWRTGGETYIPKFCNQSGASNISIRGKHRGCDFIVGVTPDTRINSNNLTRVTFDLSESCVSMLNPATFVLSCGNSGVIVVGP